MRKLKVREETMGEREERMREAKTSEKMREDMREGREEMV